MMGDKTQALLQGMHFITTLPARDCPRSIALNVTVAPVYQPLAAGKQSHRQSRAHHRTRHRGRAWRHRSKRSRARKQSDFILFALFSSEVRSCFCCARRTCQAHQEDSRRGEVAVGSSTHTTGCLDLGAEQP
jgi:hypothetical protein